MNSTKQFTDGICCLPIPYYPIQHTEAETRDPEELTVDWLYHAEFN